MNYYMSEKFETIDLFFNTLPKELDDAMDLIDSLLKTVNMISLFSTDFGKSLASLELGRFDKKLVEIRRSTQYAVDGILKAVKCFKKRQKGSPLPSEIYQKCLEWVREIEANELAGRNDDFYILKDVNFDNVYFIGHTTIGRSRIQGYESSVGYGNIETIRWINGRHGRDHESRAKGILRLQNRRERYIADTPEKKLLMKKLIDESKKWKDGDY